MTKRIFAAVLCGLGMIAGGLLSGCATDSHVVDDNNPYHLEQAGPEVHGEASVLYGHSAGH